MTKKKIPLSQVDNIILSNCANLRATRNRTLFGLVFGVLLAAGLITGKVTSVSVDTIFWLSLAYVAISTLDKASMGLNVLAHKRLILKLLNHMAGNENATDETEGGA